MAISCFVICKMRWWWEDGPQVTVVRAKTWTTPPLVGATTSTAYTEWRKLLCTYLRASHSWKICHTYSTSKLNFSLPNYQQKNCFKYRTYLIFQKETKRRQFAEKDGEAGEHKSIKWNNILSSIELRLSKNSQLRKKDYSTSWQGVCHTLHIKRKVKSGWKNDF